MKEWVYRRWGKTLYTALSPAKLLEKILENMAVEYSELASEEIELATRPHTSLVGVTYDIGDTRVGETETTLVYYESLNPTVGLEEVLSFVYEDLSQTVDSSGRIVLSPANEADTEREWLECLKNGLPEIRERIASTLFETPEIQKEDIEDFVIENCYECTSRLNGFTIWRAELFGKPIALVQPPEMSGIGSALLYPPTEADAIPIVDRIIQHKPSLAFHRDQIIAQMVH